MLRQVLIKNFQSIVELQYNFIDGLNVIVAENGTGKSVLNKIINLIVNYNKYSIDERKQYIRFYCSKSDIVFASDEHRYWVEIYPNVINFYAEEDGKFVFESNTIPPTLVSMLSLLISNNGFIGNLITSKQSKLLVDSSDDINTQVLGLVVNNEDADLVIETCEERMKEINSSLRSSIAVRNSLEKELNKVEVANYSHIESAVKRVYKAIDFVDNLVSVSEILEHVNPKKVIDSRLGKALDLLNDLETCYEKLDKVNKVESVNFTEKDLILLENVEKLDDSISSVLYKLRMIKDVPKTRFNSNTLGLLSKLEKLKYSLDKITMSKSIDYSKLKALEQIENLYEQVSNIVDLSNKIKEQNFTLEVMKNEIDSYGGEEYDCPIYGTIRFVNEECIHYNN